MASVRYNLFKRVCIVIALALSAGFMISRYVALNDMRQKVASLEKQLSKEESITSQMIYDMEQSVDLAQTEKEATTRLGMQRPEKYQTIYVNVRQNDLTEHKSENSGGILKSLESYIDGIKGNIVGFFSIK